MDRLKVLGQAAPSATTETDLYAASQNIRGALASSLMVCNRSASSATFRVSVSVGGSATANKDYLYYDVTISGNDTFAATLGLTLSPSDKVRVYASTANVSFGLFGSEVS